MKKPKKMTSILIQLPETEIKRLNKLAREKKLSRSALIRNMIARFLLILLIAGCSGTVKSAEPKMSCLQTCLGLTEDPFMCACVCEHEGHGDAAIRRKMCEAHGKIYKEKGLVPKNEDL